MEYNFTKSTRKFIRLEKARIRTRFLDVKKQEELITQLYKKLLAAPVAENVKKEILQIQPEIKKELPKATKKPKVKKVHPAK